MGIKTITVSSTDLEDAKTKFDAAANYHIDNTIGTTTVANRFDEVEGSPTYAITNSQSGGTLYTLSVTLKDGN